MPARAAAKKKPTGKSAKKKAAKKKPAALGHPTLQTQAVQPAAEPSAPEAPRPVSIPGAWPFPMGNRP
jgi:hypothetical protein